MPLTKNGQKNGIKFKVDKNKLIYFIKVKMIPK